MATKEALDEIQEIIDKIRSGEYLHNQSEYHSKTDCGTAHCIAGWKVARDAESIGVSLKYDTQHFDPYEAIVVDNWQMKKLAEHFSIPSLPCWEYAKERWGLQDCEAESLFCSELTLDTIQSALDKLKEKYLTPPLLPDETSYDSAALEQDIKEALTQALSSEAKPIEAENINEWLTGLLAEDDHNESQPSIPEDIT